MAKDLFSRQSALYVKYRPVYPPELYAFIYDHVPETTCAWDCATGNGQAAFVLADQFRQVMATDFSEKQLAHAKQHPNIRYTVCPAEHTPFPDNQFDLITVAQAYHWFDFTAFEKEARRVAKPGAVIAIWGYSLVSSPDEAIDALVRHFYFDVTGPYWDKERKFLDDHYRGIPFPFAQIAAGQFSMNVEWLKDDLEGYLNTWSAVQHYITANSVNPVTALREELNHSWPESDLKAFTFPVFLKLGRL